MAGEQKELFPVGGPHRSGRNTPLRLFLVEDNDDLLEMLTVQCEEIDNVEVVGSSDSAQDAIERIVAIGPDVVLIDIQLRVGSGIDVIHGIRRYRPVLHMTLLAMSNVRGEAVRVACLAAGADAFFDKLLEYKKLLIRVSNLARR